MAIMALLLHILILRYICYDTMLKNLHAKIPTSSDVTCIQSYSNLNLVNSFKLNLIQKFILTGN